MGKGGGGVIGPLGTNINQISIKTQLFLFNKTNHKMPRA